MTSKIKFDLSWGNPYFLLELLDKIYNQKLSPHDIANMSYAEDGGIEELRNLTRKVIYDTTGIDYPFIIIVNGATHGINVVLKFMNLNRNQTRVITRKLGYPFYDKMIQNANMVRVKGLKKSLNDEVLLIDSPSNPEGLQTTMGDARNTIWDSVYHNKIYTSDLKTIPTHFVNVGSYSKLLGITGSRVGWIATNNSFIEMFIKDIALHDIATVSVPSQTMIIDILNKIDINLFMILGRNSLDKNREEFSKITHIFDNQPIPEAGMFYCAEADSKALKLLKKCGINYITLDKTFVRLNIGQTLKVITETVKTILKEDKK